MSSRSSSALLEECRRAGFPAETVEPVIHRVFREVVDAVEEADFRYPPLFTSALLGRNRVYAVVERLAVTIIGNHAPEFFTPFFTEVGPLDKPFDFEGVLARALPDRRRYEVKVVSSPKAFNSTTEARVVREAEGRRYGNPVVLTLYGWWDGGHVRELGRVRWLDGVASWSWVTGVPNAYGMFARLVFAVARTYRRELEAALRRRGL